MAALSGEDARTAAGLRSLITTNFPDLEEIYSWKMPVYTSAKTKVVYIKKGKKGINLGFNQGAEIDEPKGLFEGGGQQMRHISLASPDEIDEGYFVELITAAVDQSGSNL